MTHLTDHDLEQLSAYLDGELKPSETAEIEARLRAEPELAQTLAELRWMTASMRRLPTLRAPRRYALTPEMAGQRTGGWRLPALRLATAAMAVALVTVIGLDFLGSARGFGLPSAPQAMEAPAIAQDSLQEEQAQAGKTEANAQPSFEGQVAAAEGTPPANALRAAGPSPGVDGGSQEATPPMALAAPESAASGASASFTPSPIPPEPRDTAPLQLGAEETAAKPDILRWTEILLGAGLILLLVLQIRPHR